MDKPSHHRAELKAAIEAEAAARKALSDAQTASTKADSAVYSTLSKIDSLAAEIEDAQRVDDDSLISAIAGGGDLATLAKPTETLRANLEAAEREADQWRDARKRAEEAIVARRDALDFAQRALTRAVAAVIEAEVDHVGLVKECREAQEQVLRCRARLAQLSRLLPDDGVARRTVVDFMAHAWLLEFQGNDAWLQREEAQELRKWANTLSQWPDAPALPL